MSRKIITISISEEDYNYIKDDGYLSPSKIFQIALNNIKENRMGLKEQNKVLESKIRAMQQRIFELQDG